MALKGTAKIELTDVKTGKKEVYQHDNMVTNAISEILSLNPFGMRFHAYAGINAKDFSQACIPVIPNLIGGILLYENALDEEPAKYYASMDNPVIGYSSNDVNSGTDTKRGSLNQTESGKLEDGTGYRFVFDFTTSQANGKISALGLTSKWGGIGGHGSTQDTERSSVLCVGNIEDSSSGAGVSSGLGRQTANSIVAIDPDNNIGYSARLTANNTVMVTKVKLPFTQVGLFDEFVLKIPTASVNPVYLATQKFGATYSTSSYNYATFVDGGDYIWGFQHSGNQAGNSSGSATVLWIKINKEDFSFEEGEWTLNAQLYSFGQYGTVDTSTTLFNLNFAILKDGYLYALKYNLKGVYKISLDNPTDITLLETDFAINAAPYYNNSTGRRLITGTAVNEVAGVITYNNAFISAGTVHKRADIAYSSSVSGADGCLIMNAKPGVRWGPYMLGLALSDNTFSNNDYCMRSVRVYIPTAYLATINNMASPVEKTADKTMKITYILREE